MTLYLFDYYQGMWKTLISPTPDLAFKRVEQVLVQRIEMEPTLDNVAWLANSMTTDRKGALTTPIDAPDGVLVTVLPDKELHA
jgi:hypothetical protein